MGVRDISHKEHVPSGTLALPWIKLTALEENSDIRKCGQWLDSQPFGIFYKATVSYPISIRTIFKTKYCSTSIENRSVRAMRFLNPSRHFKRRQSYLTGVTLKKM